MPHQHDDVEVWHLDQAGLTECDAPFADREAALPEARELPLVVREPMRVRFADRAASVDRQGLYLFHYRGVLRWDRPDALPTVVERAHVDTSLIYFRDDVSALFAGLATLQVHGWVHSHLGVPDKLAKMKAGLLSCTCGEIAEIGVHLLESFGYRARPVGALRVEGTYNARDDGHALMEYFDPHHQQWILVDLDTHSTFAWQGMPLSLGQIADCIHAGQPFEIVPITLPGFAMHDTSGYVAPETGNTFMTLKMLSPPHMRQWFEQMFEVPTMFVDGKRWFFHPDDARAAKAAGYDDTRQRLSREAWFARFYPEQETA